MKKLVNVGKTHKSVLWLANSTFNFHISSKIKKPKRKIHTLPDYDFINWEGTSWMKRARQKALFYGAEDPPFRFTSVFHCLIPDPTGHITQNQRNRWVWTSLHWAKQIFAVPQNSTQSRVQWGNQFCYGVVKSRGSKLV